MKIDDLAAEAVVEDLKVVRGQRGDEPVPAVADDRADRDEIHR